MNFEIRMRNVVKDLLQPVIEVSEQDRESMIMLDNNNQELVTRIRRLEEAVLNVSETGEKTLFDKMDDKMTQLKIFVEQNVQKVHDRLRIKFKDLDDYKFQNDQKMNQCMEVREDIEITKKHQYDLQAFVEKSQKDLIKQVTAVRHLLTENTKDLQAQLSKH